MCSALDDHRPRPCSSVPACHSPHPPPPDTTVCGAAAYDPNETYTGKVDETFHDRLTNDQRTLADDSLSIRHDSNYAL